MIDLARSVDVLRSGAPLIFETDTVVGIGVSVKDAESPSALYGLKSRSAAKPIAWLISRASDLSEFGKDVPDYAYALADAFWPGAFTIVVKASNRVPASYRPVSDTVGLRMPDDKAVLELIRKVGGPIAATSANLSDMPSVGSLCELDGGFAPGVERLSHANGHVSAASTVVDCTGAAPMILRAGTITDEDIKACLSISNKG